MKKTVPCRTCPIWFLSFHLSMHKLRENKNPTYLKNRKHEQPSRDVLLCCAVLYRAVRVYEKKLVKNKKNKKNYTAHNT